MSNSSLPSTTQAISFENPEVRQQFLITLTDWTVRACGLTWDDLKLEIYQEFSRMNDAAIFEKSQMIQDFFHSNILELQQTIAGVQREMNTFDEITEREQLLHDDSVFVA